MVRCIDCVKLEKCAKTNGKPQIAEVVPGCEDGKRRPITNGDKIRAMNDKELAAFLGSVQEDAFYAECAIDFEYPKGNNLWLNWIWLEENDNK